MHFQACPLEPWLWRALLLHVCRKQAGELEGTQIGFGAGGC